MIAAPENHARNPLDLGLPPIVAVRFELVSVEPIRLPAYAGSAWRGLLGHSLRRTACVTRQPTCQGCLLAGTCAYSVFFESPPTRPELASRYTALPHPFVLDPDERPAREIAAGAILGLGLNLIGPAIELLPYLIQTMKLAGERGIGRTGGRFRLREVSAQQVLGSGDWLRVYDADSGEYQRVSGQVSHAPPAPPGVVGLEFWTPVRIKRHGHFVGPAEFAPGDLLRGLVSRLSSLAAFYGSSDEASNWRRLSGAATDVRLVASDLTWSDWTRFSSRQRTTMQMGGLVGEILLEGPGVPAFWPALWLGQWTHVGKGTSFGLGKYRLSPAGRSDPLRQTAPTP